MNSLYIQQYAVYEILWINDVRLKRGRVGEGLNPHHTHQHPLHNLVQHIKPIY